MEVVGIEIIGVSIQSLSFRGIDILDNYIKKIIICMSYTNVVFKQNITKNVDRDAVERQRLDDRGIIILYCSWVSVKIPNSWQSHLQTIITIYPSC